MEQITANVYVETGLKGCNPGLVTTREGVVMIDTPVEPKAALRWRDEVASRGEVRYIIITEPHLDHIVGSHFFSGAVVSHRGTREAMLSVSVAGLREQLKQTYDEPILLPDGYQLRLPTITFTHRLDLYLGDHTFELIHLPGHTPSQIAVYIPQERVVFTGDNVFHGVQTFLHEADPQHWLESLQWIEAMDVDLIVPGHGEVCDRGYLGEQASFIQEWVDEVRKAIEKGLSREEAMDTISFLDRYPMDLGLERLGPVLQRMNVGRLYDLLRAAGERG